jgi:trk system potassium uptake protein TrkA
MRVIIVGIGGMGKELAESLLSTEKYEPVLIEKNKERCDWLSKNMDSVVFCGNGTDPELLRKAKPSEAGALVATIDSDTANIVIGKLGKNMAVPNVLVKLENSSLENTCREMGIDDVVLPNSLAIDWIDSNLGIDHQ